MRRAGVLALVLGAAALFGCPRFSAWSEPDVAARLRAARADVRARAAQRAGAPGPADRAELLAPPYAPPSLVVLVDNTRVEIDLSDALLGTGALDALAQDARARGWIEAPVLSRRAGPEPAALDAVVAEISAIQKRLRAYCRKDAVCLGPPQLVFDGALPLSRVLPWLARLSGARVVVGTVPRKKRPPGADETRGPPELLGLKLAPPLDVPRACDAPGRALVELRLQGGGVDVVTQAVERRDPRARAGTLECATAAPPRVYAALAGGCPTVPARKGGGVDEDGLYDALTVLSLGTKLADTARVRAPKDAPFAQVRHLLRALVARGLQPAQLAIARGAAPACVGRRDLRGQK